MLYYILMYKKYIFIGYYFEWTNCIKIATLFLPQWFILARENVVTSLEPTELFIISYASKMKITFAKFIEIYIN